VLIVIVLSAIHLSEAAPILESFPQTTAIYSPDPTESQVLVLWVPVLAQIIPFSDSITTPSSHGRHQVLLTQFQTLDCEGTPSATPVLQTLTSEVARILTWGVQQVVVFVAPIRATAVAKPLVVDPTKSQSLQILQGGIPNFYYH